MKIMVDIPKAKYLSLKKCLENGIALGMSDIAILNGKVLSKGHGDLVDRDEINSRFNAIYNELESLSNKPSYKELLDKFSMCLDTAPTIIEADEEGVEDGTD